jgi:phosphonate transport system substrate-binding protein
MPREIGRLLLMAPLMVLALLCGCGREEPVHRVDLDKRQTADLAEEEDALTYAYLPQYSHTVSYKRHRLLVEYLRGETGLNIKQIFPGTFDDHVAMVGQGRIDISYSNPFIYVRMARLHGARALARAVEVYGKENFRGQIICRADNRQIRTLADCRGKRWIAVDPGSAGGYLYPLGHFIENGIRKEDFAAIDFAPGPGAKQENVVLAVYAGKYDIGSIREGTLNVVADKIDISEIRVIASTRWYPGWVFAVGKSLEDEDASRIKQALCGLDSNDPRHEEILDAADIVGIIPADDKDFDGVRELSSGLGMNQEP